MKAVFFDFDGVLTTDKTGSASICKYVSRKTRIDLEVFAAVYRQYNEQLLYGKLTHRDIWGDICKELKTNIPYEVLFESFVFTPIDNDIVNLIRQIKNAGLKAGLITDNKRDRIDAIISYHHWYSLFDVIAISSEVGSGKDKADIFNITCDKIAVPPDECIFIDNTEKNLVIPGTMGMATFLYNDMLRNTDCLIAHLRKLGIPV